MCSFFLGGGSRAFRSKSTKPASPGLWIYFKNCQANLAPTQRATALKRRCINGFASMVLIAWILHFWKPPDFPALCFPKTVKMRDRRCLTKCASKHGWFNFLTTYREFQEKIVRCVNYPGTMQFWVSTRANPSRKINFFSSGHWIYSKNIKNRQVPRAPVCFLIGLKPNHIARFNPV